MASLTAFESSEASPIDGCSGVYVVVTAPSRMAAVETLRRAGFSAHGIDKADAGSEHERAALDQPGVVLWRDKSDQPVQWHRVEVPITCVAGRFSSDRLVTPKYVQASNGSDQGEPALSIA